MFVNLVGCMMMTEHCRIQYIYTLYGNIYSILHNICDLIVMEAKERREEKEREKEKAKNEQVNLSRIILLTFSRDFTYTYI